MWDAASYYRNFDVAWNDVATHCRSWVGLDGACTLVDTRMMFGCRAAANWAQRGTGLLSWLIQTAVDRVVPENRDIRRAMQLLRAAGVSEEEMKLAYVSGFIDDQPWLTILSMARTMTAVGAGAWRTVGVDPQGKKVWHEGSFDTK